MENTLLNSIAICALFFTFLSMYMTKEVLLLSQIFEMKILMDLQVLMSPKFENYIFSY